MKVRLYFNNLATPYDPLTYFEDFIKGIVRTGGKENQMSPNPFITFKVGTTKGMSLQDLALSKKGLEILGKDTGGPEGGVGTPSAGVAGINNKPQVAYYVDLVCYKTKGAAIPFSNMNFYPGTGSFGLRHANDKSYVLEVMNISKYIPPRSKRMKQFVEFTHQLNSSSAPIDIKATLYNKQLALMSQEQDIPPLIYFMRLLVSKQSIETGEAGKKSEQEEYLKNLGLIGALFTEPSSFSFALSPFDLGVTAAGSNGATGKTFQQESKSGNKIRAPYLVDIAPEDDKDKTYEEFESMVFPKEGVSCNGVSIFGDSFISCDYGKEEDLKNVEGKLFSDKISEGSRLDKMLIQPATYQGQVIPVKDERGNTVMGFDGKPMNDTVGNIIVSKDRASLFPFMSAMRGISDKEAFDIDANGSWKRECIEVNYKNTVLGDPKLTDVSVNPMEENDFFVANKDMYREAVYSQQQDLRRINLTQGTGYEKALSGDMLLSDTYSSKFQSNDDTRDTTYLKNLVKLASVAALDFRKLFQK